MPTRYTKKGTSDRGNWSEDSLNNAAKAVEQKEMGVNEAAKEFGIPKTTLKRRLKSKNFSKGSMGKPTILGIENEKKMVAHIKKLQSRGFTPSRDSVRSMAYHLAVSLQLKHSFSNDSKQAGYDWLSSFLFRNPELSIRQSEGVSIARAKGLNKRIVNVYFELLGDVLKENGLIDKPGNVFNMDETGLQLNNKPGKVVAIKGSKNVTSVTSGEKGETISVLACVSGEGYFLPPFCIMKGKNLKQEFCDGMPPGAEVKMSQKSGYVNTDLFFDWLKNHFNPRKPAGKVLLLLDGHTSHTSSIEVLEFAEKEDIILMSIPPHTSHWLQPLDRSFFKSFKSHYYSACNSFMTNNPLRKITRLQFGTLLNSAWGKSASVENGTSGFKTCGIIPFEPKAIPEYAFLSEITDRPNTDNRPTEVIQEAGSVNDEVPAIAGPSSRSDVELIVGPSTMRDVNVIPIPQSSKPRKNMAEKTPSKMLDTIHPVPCVAKVQTLKRKSQTVSMVLSSPENITTLKKRKTEKELQIKTKEEKKKEREKRKLQRHNTMDLSKKKTPSKIIKNNKMKREVTSSSESEDIDIDQICDDPAYDSDWEENDCVFCGENYNETTKQDDWIQCVSCLRWAHEGCTRYENMCDVCGKREFQQKKLGLKY